MQKYYENLTTERKLFLKQMKQLIENEFEEQGIARTARKGFALTELEREEALENNIKTISIDASWGVGKSFFAKALKTELEAKSEVKVYNFNAWKNDYHKEPLKSLIGELNEQMNFGQDMQEKADKLIANTLKVGSKVLIGSLLKQLKISDAEIEDLKSIFTGINESSLKEYKEYKKIVEGFKIALEEECISSGKTSGRTVILIDELDRCIPNFSVELLEAVKHIFNVEGVIFVFLINKEQLSESVKNLYGDVNKGEGYFKKFFDLSLELPKLNLGEYINLEYQINLEGIFKSGAENYDEIDLLNRYIFLIGLDNLNIVFTAREVNKMYRKYQIFLKSLSKNEKRNMAFSVLLGYFFIFKEKREKNFLEWLTANLKINRDIESRPEKLFSMEFKIDEKQFFKNMIYTIKNILLKIEYDHGVEKGMDERKTYYMVIPSICNIDNSVGFGNCENCSSDCSDRFGINNMSYNQMRVKNIHCGISTNRNWDLGYMLVLPINSELAISPQDAYRDDELNIRKLMDCLETKYNFIAES